MRAAFGRPVGTAARVHAGDIVILARVTAEGAKQMKEALHKASIKLPTPCDIEISKGKEIAGKIGI